MKIDADKLRAEAEAHDTRMKGPLWARDDGQPDETWTTLLERPDATASQLGRAPSASGSIAKASAALRTLEHGLLKLPPAGVASEDIIGFFRRHREDLIHALALLIDQATDRVLDGLWGPARHPAAELTETLISRWKTTVKVWAETAAPLEPATGSLVGARQARRDLEAWARKRFPAEQQSVIGAYLDEIERLARLAENDMGRRDWRQCDAYEQHRAHHQLDDDPRIERKDDPFEWQERLERRVQDLARYLRDR